MTSSRLALAIVLSLSAACAEPQRREFRTDQTIYRFSTEHIRSSAHEPHLFIRVSPPDERFDLILDSRLEGRTDSRGLPVLFSINDGPQSELMYHRTQAGTIVCRRAIASIDCGLPISIGDERWALLFPEPLIGRVDAMRARAEQFLRAHIAEKLG